MTDSMRQQGSTLLGFVLAIAMMAGGAVLAGTFHLVKTDDRFKLYSKQAFHFIRATSI